MRSIDMAYRNMQNAIVLQAVTDYRKALKGESYNKRKYKPEQIIKECEKFFRSDYYRHLTKVDGEWLIEQLRQEHIDNLRKEKQCESH